eukprot:scaffold1717_cov377-Prasinococcus_capsulatus_cf.AAC.11
MSPPARRSNTAPMRGLVRNLYPSDDIAPVRIVQSVRNSLQGGRPPSPYRRCAGVVATASAEAGAGPAWALRWLQFAPGVRPG